MTRRRTGPPTHPPYVPGAPSPSDVRQGASGADSDPWNMTAATLPLPIGSSTEATLAAVKAKTDNLDAAISTLKTVLDNIKSKTDNLDVLLSTRTKPADTQPVSIASVPSHAVTGPLTDAQLRASAVPTSLAALPALVAGSAVIGHVIVDTVPTTAVTGPVTDAQLRATAVPVSIASMPSTPVTGPLTDAALRASAVPVSLAALPALVAGGATIGKVDQGAAGAAAWPVSGPATDAQMRASAIAVSLASAPLPTGASTEATLLLIKADVDKIPASPATEGGNLATIAARLPTNGQAQMSASLPVTMASDQAEVLGDRRTRDLEEQSVLMLADGRMQPFAHRAGERCPTIDKRGQIARGLIR